MKVVQDHQKGPIFALDLQEFNEDTLRLLGHEPSILSCGVELHAARSWKRCSHNLTQKFAEPSLVRAAPLEVQQKLSPPRLRCITALDTQRSAQRMAHEV